MILDGKLVVGLYEHKATRGLPDIERETGITNISTPPEFASEKCHRYNTISPEERTYFIVSSRLNFR